MHIDKYVSEKNKIPSKVLTNLSRKVSGEVVYEAEKSQLLPLTDCSDENINEISKRLLQKVSQEYADEKQLLQVLLLDICLYVFFI